MKHCILAALVAAAATAHASPCAGQKTRSIKLLSPADVSALTQGKGMGFAKAADPSTLDAATRRIGELQAELHAEHLKTRLAQTALLDAQLRGDAAAHSAPDGSVHR